ncbi:MAG: hypothetical protein OXD38_05910 [Aestuariivita sp.]|nr:hypothetical protein [Aestuariivita sp.]
MQEIRGNEPILWKKCGSSLDFVLVGYIFYMLQLFSHDSTSIVFASGSSTKRFQNTTQGLKKET